MFINKMKKPILAFTAAVALGVTAPVAAVSIAPSGDGVIRLNAGGGAYIDGTGNYWSDDAGYNTGETGTTSETIAGTDEDELYQSERWDKAEGPELAYHIDVPNGAYVVRMHFVEFYSKAFSVGARVFDVLLEGDTVLRDFDIYSEAGANTALVKEFPVNVSDGQVDIEFLHGVENPKIAAIEIAKADAKVIRINAGGAEFVDADGNLWMADSGYTAGRTSDAAAAISGTENDLLYQSERWDPAALPELGYSINIPNGSYLLRLHFAETYPSAFNAGARVFDVMVEGNTALSSLDIYREAGANAALIKEIPVQISDGRLDIEFLHQVENPTISGIEIVELTPTAIRINAGGPEYTDPAGNVWMEDTGYNTGQESSTVEAIAGTDSDGLYQSERWDRGAAPELQYGIDVPNGRYLLKLHFAEIYPEAFRPGARIFDVSVEGNPVISDLDIYQEVGANAALVKEIPVTVQDGRLDVEFVHKVENPKIAAIEIIPASGGSGSSGGGQTGGGDTSGGGGNTDPTDSTNHRPLANSDSVTVERDASVTIDVLANDMGLEDGPITLTLVDNPTLGSAAVSGDKVVYAADSGLVGSDDFNYRVTDIDGDVTTATVNVNVVCSACVADSVITLSWAHPNPTNVFGYTVYYGSTPETANQILGMVNTQSVTYQSNTDLRLASGDTACFRVTAYNDVGESDPSPTVCHTF